MRLFVCSDSVNLTQQREPKKNTIIQPEILREISHLFYEYTTGTYFYKYIYNSANI